MTTGALIFAYNNEAIDYVAMAKWSADNIRRHLDIPVAIVTDQASVEGFDAVITTPTLDSNRRYFSDFDLEVTWHNQSRTDAYALTPWDRTLVLDADYIVASDQLRSLLSCDQDFLCHRWAYDVTNINDFSGLNYFGLYKMPQWWATVMLFRRGQTAELIFGMMDMIKNNWRHYRDLYHNARGAYRNDHALSIALNTVNGHVQPNCEIPWTLASLVPEHKLYQTDQDSYRIEFTQPDGRHRWIRLCDQDFHAMGKLHLGEIVANTR